VSEPADLEGPLILDSSVLVAYERVRAPRGDLQEAQSLVAEWMTAEVTPFPVRRSPST
jgi:hypothetical protein